MALHEQRSGVAAVGTTLLGASLIAAMTPMERNSPAVSAILAGEPATGAIVERRAAAQPTDTLPLSIGNVQLRSAPDIDATPSAFIMFEVTNEGWQSVTDIVVEISIVEKSHRPDATRKVLVGPFTIRGKVTLDPGNALSYEMRLRNLSSDCNCLGTARIVSSRPMADWLPTH